MDWNAYKNERPFHISIIPYFVDLVLYNFYLVQTINLLLQLPGTSYYCSNWKNYLWLETIERYEIKTEKHTSTFHMVICLNFHVF